jgi:hypothetical protein
MVTILSRLVTPYITAPTISAETEAAIFVVLASTILLELFTTSFHIVVLVSWVSG